MKSTVKLVYLCCAECGQVFELSKGDYQRRLKKLPSSTNFFCSRGCGGAWRSKNVKRPANDHPTFLRDYRKQHNITNNKYDINFVWYANRIAMDVRSHAKVSLTRSEIINVLKVIWEQQDGKCAVTGVPLFRRITCHGRCGTDNPFFIASVDRKDSNQPYTIDNIQWISLGLNLAKQHIDDGMFRQHLSAFVETLR